jgi:hypothetical protein
MANKKRKGSAPVPPGNKPQGGPAMPGEKQPPAAPGGAPFNDQDEKRRLGGYQTAGEHAIQQPSELNDGGKGNR